MSVSKVRRSVATSLLVLAMGAVPLVGAATTAHAEAVGGVGSPSAGAARPAEGPIPCAGTPLEGLFLSLGPVGGFLTGNICTNG
ncbi:hypothetical protein SAMN05216371_5696 [Streptomyces sp. TLI_053]|uniref:hypothetical protein n=1 Tax=Streptomyces sp. TLI_053 TaxID=1855352 RepID=UPI000879C483|nr:hypothetical protein [Streptomyces sp. TLI_053]SDT78337.1 hypothetical protein SAMN05216371_5696 [Streptomyces sp. TLI_053]